MYKALLIAFLGASLSFAADEPKKTPPKIDPELRVTYWKLDAQASQLQVQLSDINKQRQEHIDRLVKACGEEYILTLDNGTKDLVCAPKVVTPPPTKIEDQKTRTQENK